MSYVEDVPYEVAFSPSYVKHKISPYVASIEIAPVMEKISAHSLPKHRSVTGPAISLAPLYAEVGEILPDKFGLKAITLSKLDVGPEDDPLPAYNKKFYHGAISKNYVISLPKVKGFYFGVDASVHQNRLFLKEQAFYPLIDKNVEFTFDWGYSYGFSAGYNFSRKFGIETELILNSVQGMSYSDNLFGKIPREGSIRLSYMSVPVMAKYKWCKVSTLTGQPVSFNLVGGVLYNRLRGVEMKINKTELPSADELFATNELGLLLGLEYDMYVHKNFFFTVGARGSISTDVKTIGRDANAYNLLLGVNASFNYQLPNLKKKHADKPQDIE
jgi:hypothetical protein